MLTAQEALDVNIKKLNDIHKNIKPKAFKFISVGTKDSVYRVPFTSNSKTFAEHSYILREYNSENRYTMRASRMDIKNVFFKIKEKKIKPPLKLHTIREGIHLFDIWELQKFNYFYYEPIRTEQDLLILKMEFLDSYFGGFQYCSNSKVYIERDIV